MKNNNSANNKGLDRHASKSSGTATTAPRSRMRTTWLAAIGAAAAMLMVAPSASSAWAQPTNTTAPPAAAATSPQEQVEKAAEQGQRLEIERRGALLVEWGSGMEDVQYIQGGYLQMDGNSGRGEVIVRDGWTGEIKTYQIPSAYPSMGGLGLEIDVKSGGMFPQVVTFSSLAAGSPLYQGPDGGYEGDLEDWAGINDMEVFGLSFR
ncbi:MAG: hypothetical protein K0U64_01600 [Actinomycetia bacterium]|nr:hypothetical protein [Actinomycetes bacterium]